MAWHHNDHINQSNNDIYCANISKNEIEIHTIFSFSFENNICFVNVSTIEAAQRVVAEKDPEQRMSDGCVLCLESLIIQNSMKTDIIIALNAMLIGDKNFKKCAW